MNRTAASSRPLAFAAGCAALLAAAAASAGQQMQGQQMQGQQMQGQQMQGTSLDGAPVTPAEPPVASQYAGWMSGQRVLGTARLDKGVLSVATRRGVLSGAALIGAVVPSTRGAEQVAIVIRDVQPDPTFPEGGTALYAVDVLAADGTGQPLCRTDAHGVAAAIPVAATWNEHGDRVESSSRFTFACTAGVIAKCYRWGYRPWLDGGGGNTFSQLHQSCTRMARADYCGDGHTNTFEGTLINLLDTSPAPGPLTSHGPADPTFFFEAGWAPQGAVCLSKQRWVTLPPDVAARCPDRLVAPGASTGVATVCDTDSDALLFDASTNLFNESRLNTK